MNNESNEYKKDCFAFVREQDNFCRALSTVKSKNCKASTVKVKDCKNCNFYRTDLKQKDIEKDIEIYRNRAISSKGELYETNGNN